MNVNQIIRDKARSIISVQTDDSIMDALRVLNKHGIGALLVMNDAGGLAGVMSERDVARNLPQYGASLLDKPVSSIMTANVITCQLSDSIAMVMEIMTGKKIRHLPVFDGDELSAVISIGDVVKAKIAEAEAESESLKAYIATG